MIRSQQRSELVTAALLALLLLGALSSMARVVAYTPQSGDSFSYAETITVNNGQGVYTGYTDQTTVSGQEQVTGVSGSIVSATYSYSLQFSSNQGSSESSSTGGPYTWSLSNYTYVSGTDNQSPLYSRPIYVWFAMNTSIPVGGTFYSLNTQMTVVSKNATFQFPSEGKYVQAIQAQGTGQYQRNDSYGVFQATYTWDEYYDPATGYIVGYTYVEQDNGQYSGQTGGFTENDDVWVSSTSYPLTTVSAPSTSTSQASTGSVTSVFSPDVLEVVLGVVVVLVIVVAVALVLRSRGKKHQLPEHSPPPPSPPQAPPPSGPQPGQPWQSGVNLGSTPSEQVVIKEIPKVRCKYCGTLIPVTAETCPYCGAPTN